MFLIVFHSNSPRPSDEGSKAIVGEVALGPFADGLIWLHHVAPPQNGKMFLFDHSFWEAAAGRRGSQRGVGGRGFNQKA
jgi:hypothetical protein